MTPAAAARRLRWYAAHSMGELYARDVMTPDVMAVSEDLTLREIAQFLIEREITGAPVVDGRGRLLGIVSLSDIARATGGLERPRGAAPHRFASRPAAAGSGPPERSASGPALAPGAYDVPPDEHALRVRDIMSTPVVTVGPDTPLEEVARTMLQARFHRVLVAAGDELLGVVSSMDLVRVLADFVPRRS